MTSTTLDQLREELLAKPAVRGAYEKQAPEYAIARAIIAARAHAGLSQAELAARMTTSQPFVARLEGRPHPAEHAHPAEGRRSHRHGARVPPEAETRGPGPAPQACRWCEASMIPDVPHRFTIRPLSEDGGGGYLIEFPDLPGWMSDGETVEEAILHGVDAMRGWIEAMRAEGHPIPEPTRSAAA
jgi:predicted RNase H-like HicB family nuclease